MNDKIRAYLDHEFADAPQTRKVLELKEELLANLEERHAEELARGRSEAEAYNLAVGGLGDISELLESVKPRGWGQPDPRERKTRALLTSIAVGMYILSPFMVMLFGNRPEPTGIILMFLLIAAATGILVYNNMTRPVYKAEEDTVVEDFKEWRSSGERNYNAYKSFRGAFWSLVVAVYLLVSFLTMSWPFSWIIFIIGAAIDGIIKGVLQLKGVDK